jgi:glycine cleavage system aminomethyltransferase T
MIRKARGCDSSDSHQTFIEPGIEMKRSALFHLHRTLGGKFVEHFGWQMPSAFSEPSDEAAAARAGVGLADVSYRAKLLTAAQPEKYWWRLGARRYLMIGSPPLDAPADATDVTSVYTNLLLAGPRSRQVLSKLTSLNLTEQSLPNLSCAQSGVAHVHCIILREDLPSMPAYHLLAGRDFAESLWESIEHAGKEFELRPFGETALRALNV